MKIKVTSDILPCVSAENVLMDSVVYVCIYTHMYMYVYICVCIYTCTHKYTHKHMPRL